MKIPFKIKFGQIISHGKNAPLTFIINLCFMTFFDRTNPQDKGRLILQS